jgi:hypothetical protein
VVVELRLRGQHVEHVGFALDQVGAAWLTQAAGRDAKVTASIRCG